MSLTQKAPQYQKTKKNPKLRNKNAKKPKETTKKYPTKNPKNKLTNKKNKQKTKPKPNQTNPKGETRRETEEEEKRSQELLVTPCFKTRFQNLVFLLMTSRTTEYSLILFPSKVSLFPFEETEFEVP